jgi:HEAT repeat protein
MLLFPLFTALSSLGVGILIRKGKSTEANKVNAAAADALICIKDPRSVPSLIEVATEKYAQSARASAMWALRETLPVLNTGDYGLLTSAVERRLTGMFALHNPPLTLASVRALEFVGTGQSVGPLERLARRRTASSAAIYADIRSEAQRVLPVLVERKRLEEASSVLLRPSQVAPDSSGILLRPVSSLSAYEEPVDQLLRPGHPD